MQVNKINFFKVYILAFLFQIIVTHLWTFFFIKDSTLWSRADTTLQYVLFCLFIFLLAGIGIFLKSERKYIIYFIIISTLSFLILLLNMDAYGPSEYFQALALMNWLGALFISTIFFRPLLGSILWIIAFLMIIVAGALSGEAIIMSIYLLAFLVPYAFISALVGNLIRKKVTTH